MKPFGLRRALAVLSCALALFLPACGSSPTTPNTATNSAVTVTVTPNPIIAAKSANLAFDYQIQWVVTLTETNGLGGTVVFVNSTLYDVGTGAAAGRSSLDSSDLLVLTGSKRLNAKSSLVVNQNLSYRLPSRGRTALLAVDTEVKDDSGNVIDQSVLVQVQ